MTQKKTAYSDILITRGIFKYMELKSKENCLDKEFTLIQIKSLFDKLIELAGLNYDYKLLCFKTMQQNCS